MDVGVKDRLPGNLSAVGDDIAPYGSQLFDEQLSHCRHHRSGEGKTLWAL